MSSVLKLEVLSIDVVDPEAPRRDPTGVVRATNGTGKTSVVDKEVDLISRDF